MMRRKVARGLYVRNTDPEKQVAEVLDRLDLRGRCRPFTRCIECNGAIEALDPDDAGSGRHRGHTAGRALLVPRVLPVPRLRAGVLEREPLREAGKNH